MNYHTLSDQAFDPDIVFAFWEASLPDDLRGKLSRTSCTIEPVKKAHRTVKYLLKYWSQDDPEEYLPEWGRYRKIFFTSPNYNAFIMDHLFEAQADKVLGEYTSWPA